MSIPDPPEPTMAADALRAGDRLWTGGQWEQVAVDAHTAEGVVYVGTLRGGQARARTFRPGEQVRALRADPRHPAWCDPGECQMGTDAPDPYHRSAVHRVEAVRVGEPDITLQLWQTADEPIEAGPPGLVLTFDTSFLVPDVRAYRIEPHQALALQAELGNVATILATRNGER